MKLYEINEGLRALIEGELDRLVDEDTGEVFDSASLDALRLARAEKIEGCCVVHKELLKEAEALGAEAKTLLQRKKSLERRAEWLKNYLTFCLNGERFTSPKCSVSYRRSTAVEVSVEPENLPEIYVSTTYAADKAAIKEALKSGAEIEGCRLVENTSIQIK